MNGGKTGSPPGMLQDDCKALSQWLASRLDARLRAREAAAMIELERNPDMTSILRTEAPPHYFEALEYLDRAGHEHTKEDIERARIAIAHRAWMEEIELLLRIVTGTASCSMLERTFVDGKLHTVEAPEVTAAREMVRPYIEAAAKRHGLTLTPVDSSLDA